VRARAASTSAATRREVEQSIARFEKRLDDANDALQTLGKHLGRGAQGGYKEVTATLRALRRDAGKANKQALKDFDKLRQALTQATASTASRATRSGTRTNSGTTRSGSRSTSRSTASRSTAARPTAKRSTAKRSTAKRSTAKRSTAKRSTAKRSTAASRAKKS
jgi:DNA-binding protein HU-beta